MAIATGVEQDLIDRATAVHGELCPGLRHYQGRELCIPDYHKVTGRS